MQAGALHLEAMHLQAPLVINVHILLLGRCEELLIVQQLHVSNVLPDLQPASQLSPATRPGHAL